MPRQYTPRVQIICERCAKPFEVVPRLAKQRFCSLECRYAGCKSRRDYTCEVCGSPFTAYESTGNHRFCSRPCQYIAKRGKRVRWNGGRTMSRGYVFVQAPNHPSANSKGYVAEHRLITEQSIGRRLRRGEIVHHIDGNKANNDPENLQVMTQSDHARLHKASNTLT